MKGMDIGVFVRTTAFIFDLSARRAREKKASLSVCLSVSLSFEGEKIRENKDWIYCSFYGYAGYSNIPPHGGSRTMQGNRHLTVHRIIIDLINNSLHKSINRNTLKEKHKPGQKTIILQYKKTGHDSHGLTRMDRFKYNKDIRQYSSLADLSHGSRLVQK